MKIDVKHIAGLAKLRIGDGEIPLIEEQMKNMLDMVDNLPEINGVIAVDANNVMALRPDEIIPSLSRDEVLANAPQKQAGCIVVPRTVG